MANSRLTLCDPMDCGTPGSSALHYSPGVSQTHVHWVDDAIQPSHPLRLPTPFAFGFLASRSLPMSRLFSSDGQSIGVSVNIEGWVPLVWFDFGLTSLQSRGLSRVFSSTTTWNYQFFSAQSSLGSNFHIHSWLLEKPWLWLDCCRQSDVSVFLMCYLGLSYFSFREQASFKIHLIICDRVYLLFF